MPKIRAASRSASGTPFCTRTACCLVLLLAGTLHAQKEMLFTGGTVPGAHVADLNHDGLDDRVQPPTYFEGVGVRLGHPDGSFGPAVIHGSGIQFTPVALALCDVNGDGELDIVHAGSPAISVVAYLGHGDGAFGAPIVSPQPDTPLIRDLDAGDLDGDGRLDLVLTEHFFITGEQPNLRIALGNGDGTFAESHKLGMEHEVQSVIVDDFDGTAMPISSRCGVPIRPIPPSSCSGGMGQATSRSRC